MGKYFCVCGAGSSADYLLDGKMATNHLCAHYLAYNRDEIASRKSPKYINWMVPEFFWMKISTHGSLITHLTSPYQTYSFKANTLFKPFRIDNLLYFRKYKTEIERRVDLLEKDIFKMEKLPTIHESDDKQIKRLLKKQGYLICRNKMDPEVLNAAIERYDHAVVFMNHKAHTGQTLAKLENRYQVTGFALIEELNQYTIHLNLICVLDSHKGDGNTLMDTIFKYAEDNNFLEITLYSLPENRLLDWYQSFGFRIINQIYSGEELKVYSMTRAV